MKNPTLVSVILLSVGLGAVLSAKRDQGVFLGSFTNYVHGIKGDVYALDNKNLYIEDFSYDGLGPDAFFWGGHTAKPDRTGTIISDETNSNRPLESYTNRDITITLPEGLTVKKLKWLSVWCREFGVNFGDLILPRNIELPVVDPTVRPTIRPTVRPTVPPTVRPTAKPTVELIGRLRTKGHRVGGEVVAFDDQTIVINKFTYDGRGPAVYFWADYGNRLTSSGQLLGSSLTSAVGDSLPRADGNEMVIVKIPEGRTINDYKVFGVWSEETAESFGDVRIPASINVPQSKGSTESKKKSKLNCEVLDDDSAYEVRWALTDDNIVMQLVGRIDEGNYMSFGLSGNEERSDMVGGDVVVAWIDGNGEGHAEDYHLKSKESCSRNKGACPDTVFGKAENVDLLNSAVVNGFNMVTVKRPLFKQDDVEDAHIYVDGPQAVIWAIGRLNSEDLVTYHFNKRNKDALLIDFARKPSWNCPEPDDNSGPSSAQAKPKPKPKPQIAQPKEKLVPWEIPKFTCPRQRRFRARIGPSGGRKGYEAITGEAGWGIAWYLNGILLPEITLQRGRTYIFEVEGGNDPDNSAKTHPFYITSSSIGGYANADEEQQQNEIIYAGAEVNRRTGEYEATAVGRLCEYTATGNKKAEDYATFDAFKQDLRVKCERGRSSTLRWRPTADTPDTVYYQCFTHKRLGYKINIVDSCDNDRGSASVLSIKKVPSQQNVDEKEKKDPKPSSVYNSKPAELPRPIVRQWW